jgi:hypothetical protein
MDFEDIVRKISSKKGPDSGSEIRDPGSGKNSSQIRIPDPRSRGVKKHRIPDLRSRIRNTALRYVA